MKKTLSLVVLMLAASAGYASPQTGTVAIFRSAPSPTTPGNTRFSVLINGAVSSCGSGSWYSYDWPDSGAGAGVGKVFTATFLAAIASGRTVTVAGTGVCDPYNIETIYYVDAL